MPDYIAKLSPDQINFIESELATKEALEASLQVAINYNVNQNIQLRESSQKFWRELEAIHGLDLDNHSEGYEITYDKFIREWVLREKLPK